MITGYLPSAMGRNTSARSTSPSSIEIGTSQSIRIPSLISLFSPDPIDPPFLALRSLAPTARRHGQYAHARSRLEHDPEKWTPVFGKDHAPTITYSEMALRRKAISL